MAQRDATVAIVGAGMSGLFAARELHRQGIDVLVLEAADRLGGRALTETTVLGSRVDLGGQWIGHDHHRVTALAAELGATKYAMHTRTLPQAIDGDRTLSMLSPEGLEATACLTIVAALSEFGGTERWGDSTVQSWLDHVPGASVRRLLEVIAQISWTVDLDRYSVDSLAKMIRREGGIKDMLSTSGGAQESLLVEGIGALIDGMAAELGPRVRTGSRVTAIVRDDSGVTLRTSSGEVRAAKVIVTAAPPMARKIAHQPALPPGRVALEENTSMGSVYKAIAVYDEPFWREGKGGEFIILDRPGGGVFDTSPVGGPGHLCFLAGGPSAREMSQLDAQARREAVLAPLARHLGSRILQPAGWHEKSWHLDEFVGGGYSAVPDPGMSELRLPMWSEPIGHIHWAGTETADDHAGYYEGAIESGSRVAREVAAALTANTTRGTR